MKTGIVKWVIIGAIVIVIGLVVVNNFILDEPIVENQATIENTEPGDQAGPTK